MIENIVISYLFTALAYEEGSSVVNIPVSGEVPTPLPDVFVTVEKTGGRIENHIRSATLAIQSWAKSQEKASELNEQVIAAMESLTALDAISKCKLNSDYNYTDTSTKHNRYQAVFDLVYFD